MIIKNVTKNQMNKALNRLNKKYEDNIEFMELEPVGRRYKFRLKAKSFEKEGWRRSFTGKRMKNACWHVHGEFFDIILDMVNEAVIRSSAHKIYNDQYSHSRIGNWQDWNIGSQMQPMYFSKACKHREGIKEDISGVRR